MVHRRIEVFRGQLIVSRRLEIFLRGIVKSVYLFSSLLRRRLGRGNHRILKAIVLETILGGTRIQSWNHLKYRRVMGEWKPIKVPTKCRSRWLAGCQGRDIVGLRHPHHAVERVESGSKERIIGHFVTPVRDAICVAWRLGRRRHVIH